VADEALQSLRGIAQQVDSLLEVLADGSSPGAQATSPGAGLDGELSQLLLRLGSSLRATELWEAIVDGVVTLTTASRSFLMLLEEGNKLRFKAGRNVDHAALAGKEFTGSRHLIREVLKSGTPMFLSGNELPAHGLIHLSGVLCVPISFGQRSEGRLRIKGALYADMTTPPTTFTPRQFERLQVLADHAGVALENALLHGRSSSNDSQVLRLRNNLSRLHDVGRSINSTLILEDLLVLVVDHVVEICRAMRGFVMLLEGPPGDRKVVYKVGRDARQNTIDEAHFNYSTTVAQRVLQGGKPVVMVDTVGSDLSASMLKMSLQSIMCVPLAEKGEVLGLLYVDSRQENREFATGDLELMESLAGHASVAIINAKLYQEAGERERLAHELNIAARLQRDMLPKEIPPVAGLELHGTLTPALEVGGDYYDFIPHEGTNDSLTIAIGDVSGKGVGAGLVMAMARSALRSLVEHHGVPDSTLPIMRSLNVMLCRDIPAEMFMTLNVLIWDASQRRVRYTSAGHEHVLVFRASSGQVEAIRGGGVACGVIEQASAMLSEHELELASGDQLLLYTDGVTEAMNVAHQPIGLERVQSLLQQHGGQSPEALCTLVQQAITEHRGAADPHDDITLVALRAI
jgi:serine phosphatase RsbU (regulator of sigma subunit)